MNNENKSRNKRKTSNYKRQNSKNYKSNNYKKRKKTSVKKDSLTKLDKDNNINKENDTLQTDFVEEEMVEEQINNDRIIIDIGSKKHIDFKTRLIGLSILFIISLLITIGLGYLYLNFKDDNEIYYNEDGIVDYYFNTKENSNLGIISKKNLENNENVYFTDLIDKIKVDFDYNFDINKESDINLRYNVIAEIVIKDINNERELYSDKFVLLKKDGINIKNRKHFDIHEIVDDIDYNYYQIMAKSYSNQFGEETNNYLKIYLEVQKQNDINEKNIILDDYDEISVNIPLNENVLLSDVEDSNINQENQRIEKNTILRTKRDILCIMGVFLVLVIYFLFHIYNLLSLLKVKKSEYEKYIEKILSKYDKYVAESTTIIDLKKYDVIKIKNFDELLDIYNNLEIPIIYCEIVKGQKSYFYIKNNNDIYLLQVKAVDLEKRN